ncbi:MAG: DNA polymerase III subunit beta [Firmicutes bacterium]|nr:DNA polymerase III subunit beta [Bacillota bacterium]
MKLICDGLDLSDAVLKVIKAVSNKTTNPILEGILLTAEGDRLTLVSTDTELSIIKSIKADVKIEGETVVPGKFFSEFTKKLTGEQINLTLNTANNQLKIEYSDSEGFIGCLNAAEFPTPKLLSDADYFSLKQADFRALVNKSIFAVSGDDSRPLLKGCLIEINDKEVRAVALDGIRLALVKKPVIKTKVNTGLIVPARSLVEIAKLLNENEEEVKVLIQKNNIMVDLGDIKVITRLLGGGNDFINYRQIIPTEFSSVITINKLHLEDALERVSLLSRVEKNNVVKFEIAEKLLTLKSMSEIGNIKENLSIVLNGKDLIIEFNARLFMDCLRANNDEFVKLSFNNNISPCVVCPEMSEEFLYLVLPVHPR